MTSIKPYHVATTSTAVYKSSDRVCVSVQVDLIHQANEQMFRYLKYVQQRLSSHTAELEASPELMKLLRDLHMWCARESSGRCVMPVTPSICGSSTGKQANKTCGSTPVFRSQAMRPALMASCRARLNT